MTSVTDTVTIAAPLEQVYTYCWNAEIWPSITSHVRSVEMVVATATEQYFCMVVESEGKSYSVESKRTTKPNEWIRYAQEKPPLFLAEHSGEWRFQSIDQKTHVELIHRFVAEENAREVLGLAADVNVDTFIGERLKANGVRTLCAIKNLLEAEQHQPKRGDA